MNPNPVRVLSIVQPNLPTPPAQPPLSGKASDISLSLPLSVFSRERIALWMCESGDSRIRAGDDDARIMNGYGELRQRSCGRVGGVGVDRRKQQYQICQQHYKHDQAKMAVATTRTTTFAMDWSNGGINNLSADSNRRPFAEENDEVEGHDAEEEEEFKRRRIEEQFLGATVSPSCCNQSSHNHQHHHKTAFRSSCSSSSSCFSTTTMTRRHHNLVFLVLATLFVLLVSSDSGSAFLLDGSQSSFAQFRKWYTGLNGTLELEFKSDQPNGLVLYTDDGGTYDFFELKLVEGVLRLRYNLGGGAQIITVGRDLHDGHWHKVQVCKQPSDPHYLG